MFPFKYRRTSDGSSEGFRHTRSPASVKSDPVPPQSRHESSTRPAMGHFASSSTSSRTEHSTTNPQASSPVTIPSRNSSRGSNTSRRTGMRDVSDTQSRRKTPHNGKTPQHKKDAVPASVAALLAITAIPPRKTSHRRRSDRQHTKISIDQLVEEWRSESLVMPSYGSSHKSMEVLLEATPEGTRSRSIGSADEEYLMPRSVPSRSISSDSIPSLELDNSSLLSLANPPTPDGAHASKQSPSSTPSRRIKARSLTPSEDCVLSHPLLPRVDLGDASDSTEDDFPTPLAMQPVKSAAEGRKSFFKSNLTSSLQLIKTRALSSLSQLSLNNAGPNLTNRPYALTDDTLWQHPFIFPRLSPEVRIHPYSGTPTESNRRYFNPSVLSFDEQQSHYRQALHEHGPDLSRLSDPDRPSPLIQMKTYNRAPAPKRSQSKGTNVNSEAGRAMSGAGPPLVRQREPRENSDFLRVVVLEMNMRRKGKLEETMGGRARIWLPPRQNVVLLEAKEKAEIEPDEQETKAIPRRWLGVSVDA